MVILVQTLLLSPTQMLNRNRFLVCLAITVNWLFGYLSAIALYVKDEQPGKYITRAFWWRHNAYYLHSHMMAKRMQLESL